MYKARIKRNTCTNSHPVGCFYNVYDQILKTKEKIKEQPDSKAFNLKGNTALVIGASSGIGLASRIALTFGAGMDTIGVYFDRAAQAHKMGAAGFYNNQALEYYARRADKMSISTNQDAFQKNAKDWVIQKLQQQDKKIDILVYSLASAKRSVKGLGDYHRTIKPINSKYVGINLDPFKAELNDLEIEAATQDEIDSTIKVMGGEDWQEWVARLKSAGVLAENFKTIAYSSLAPDHTKEIFDNGTLGKARSQLHETAIALDQRLQSINGRAHIGLFQALLTPSISVAPTMPLYVSVLNQLQKKSGTYEETIEHVLRLFSTKLFNEKNNDDIKLRVDNFEREPELQKELSKILASVNQGNLNEVVDLESFKTDFLHQFGFNYDFIDYEEKPDPLTPPSIYNFSDINLEIAV
ncbi:MAG: enoyl-[acyl-carrier protein] reductase/trans-2-enoyl-CoA reductase (NAD+) [Crocinitomicaceae bacterium]|jgi:enoyl-[acyl-carrier protein] reductase/trans-2-enoyl-CoA reductase (NAD+)